MLATVTLSEKIQAPSKLPIANKSRHRDDFLVVITYRKHGEKFYPVEASPSTGSTSLIDELNLLSLDWRDLYVFGGDKAKELGVYNDYYMPEKLRALAVITGKTWDDHPTAMVCFWDTAFSFAETQRCMLIAHDTVQPIEQRELVTYDEAVKEIPLPAAADSNPFPRVQIEKRKDIGVVGLQRLIDIFAEGDEDARGVLNLLRLGCSGNETKYLDVLMGLDDMNIRGAQLQPVVAFIRNIETIIQMATTPNDGRRHSVVEELNTRYNFSEKAVVSGASFSRGDFHFA